MRIINEGRIWYTWIIIIINEIIIPFLRNVNLNFLFKVKKKKTIISSIYNDEEYKKYKVLAQNKIISNLLKSTKKTWG